MPVDFLNDTKCVVLRGKIVERVSETAFATGRTCSVAYGVTADRMLMLMILKYAKTQIAKTYIKRSVGSLEKVCRDDWISSEERSFLK
jgi:hypothetical protein